MANRIDNISTDFGLRVGEWVEVRSMNEIVSRLEPRGKPDELPFMPDMIKFSDGRVRESCRDYQLQQEFITS